MAFALSAAICFLFFFSMPFKFFRWWVYSILSPASPTCGMYILPARVLQCVFLSLSSPLLLLREFIIVGNWGETFAVSSSLPSNCKLFPAHWFLFFVKRLRQIVLRQNYHLFCETPLSSWMISCPRKCEYEIQQKAWIPWKMLVTLLILRSDHRILANRVTLDYEIPLYGLNTA